MIRQKSKVPEAVVLLAGLALILIGCGSGEEQAAEEPPANAVVVGADAPLRAPVWAEDEQVMIALQEDGQRIVSLDPDAEGDETREISATLSSELEGTAGENLALEGGREPDVVYVPIPERDQVAVIENDDLLEVRVFDAGEAPARVALGDQPLGYADPILFALSEDGSTVTVVGLENFEQIAEVEVGASEDALIEASGGDEIGFWLAGPGGVALYSGDQPEYRGELSLEAGALAVDPAYPERAYVGDSASGRVVAVEPDEGGSLQIVAETDLGGPVKDLATEAGLYAVTSDELVILDSETLEIVETLELDPILEEGGVAGATPSGLAVSEENVLVTLEGEPYVLLAEKP